jgi:nitrile hydratase accessory protein
MNAEPAPTLFLCQPSDEKGPVFVEAWQAQAFAMTLTLHDRGVFSWAEWTETLSQEIHAAQAAGDTDLGDTYYHHWLKALERIIADKGVTTPDLISKVASAWHEAARSTPHGQPIELPSAKVYQI